ncbi:FUSC family protein [Kitasatospora sp. NBC_01560]|uniref:FUSC family protein n=1 Tax=Kitasatospora sp. NBC_01560 TaxID=2975965 RepID=UPI0038643CA7
MGRSPGRTGPPRRRARPDAAAVHRAVRVTLAACIGFYTFRYGLHSPVSATYALFGAVAVGVLARVEGSARARSRTLLLTLPFACALVCLGTALAVHAWTAALGMVGVGFAVSFGAVGGPRLVGLANGLQLFYILPCFPPFRPDTLPQRLAGVAVGLLLLAAAERLLWPEPAPPDYRDRLARAASALADLADVSAAACAGRPVAPPVAGGTPPGPGPPGAGPPDAAPPGAGPPGERARALLDDLRFSRIPVMERPASAGAVDRALTHCAIALHYTGRQLYRLLRFAGADRPNPGAAVLATATGQALRAAAAGVREGGPVPVTGPIDRELATFDAARAADGEGPGSTTPVRLALGTVALDAAEGARFVTRAATVSRRAPLPPDGTPADQWPGPFWYAHEPAPLLWWRRFRGNLTTHSVFFRNALRTALALGAARLVAGAFDLSHGFWVLLATLTLMRTSATDTRMTLRPALVGTAGGAAVTAAMLLLIREHPVVYAAALPPVMLLAFAVGPALGLAWGQGLFTVVVALVFTQLAPASWRLAEARLVNVATGAAIGILAGLCAWPRGGGQDLRRRTAALLEDGAEAVRETVAVVTGTGPAGGALARLRRSSLLTEALYAQYRSERHDPAEDGPNWQAAVLTGQHTLRGAEPLLARIPPGTAMPGPDGTAELVRRADEVAAAFRREAAALRAREPAGAGQDALARERAALSGELMAATGLPTGAAALHAVDVTVWLTGLLDDLEQVRGPAVPAPAPQA